MVDNIITLALDGQVSMKDYARVMGALSLLVESLQRELVPDADIQWDVADLQAGSAFGSFQAISGPPDAIDRVVKSYAYVGRVLSQGEPIPYSPRVRRAASTIVGVINGRIPAIRFETPSEDFTVISSRDIARFIAEDRGAYGAISGRVQTVSNREGLHFTLYDNVHDKAVSCYLVEGVEELLRGLWGSRAVVHGWIKRDPLFGRPTLIRGITRIDKIPTDEPERYKYLEARGIIKAEIDSESPEDVIRRIRNAWS